MVRVETVLDSWKTVRQDTVQAVEEFPASEFDFRPTPEMSSFREIARHIADAGHALTGLLLAGEENLSGPDFRQKLNAHLYGLPAEADGPALADALRRSTETRVTELAACTPEWFARVITRFDGQRVTRLEMVQFVKEHELAHRSQLFVYMRLKGLVPATTRRRQAKTPGK